jgi:hypothetical protein
MSQNEPDEDRLSTKEGESRALPYDPGKMLVRRKAVTAPLKPLEEAVRNRSPVMLVFGAIIILGMIMLAVVLAAGGEDDLGGIELSGISASGSCMVVAPDDVNVRSGPGYDYERVWIMTGGDSDEAFNSFDQTWLRLESGWVAVSEITLQSSSACAQLPQSTDPVIYQDDITVPDAIDALEWHEILTESFATSINGWVESADGAGAQISEGELVLSTSDDGAAVTVYPADAAGWGDLMDGYITFRLQWSGAASDDQQLGLNFRMDGPNFYQLSVTPEGDVGLWRASSDGLTQMSQVRVRDVEVVERMVLGLLFVGEEMRVFVNDDLRITTSDAAISQGRYHLELRGQNASVRITRFEVKVPPEQVDSVLGGQ